MKENPFGIIFLKPNKTTGLLEYIPDSEVDFSKQFFLVTDEKWFYIFSCKKAKDNDWKKSYVYCPNNPNAINELYKKYPEIKIIEIIKKIELTGDEAHKSPGFLGVFCSEYDFKFSDTSDSKLIALRNIMIQPPFTKTQVKRWLNKSTVPSADKIRYLYDKDFNRI